MSDLIWDAKIIILLNKIRFNKRMQNMMCLICLIMTWLAGRGRSGRRDIFVLDTRSLRVCGSRGEEVMLVLLLMLIVGRLIMTNVMIMVRFS